MQKTKLKQNTQGFPIECKIAPKQFSKDNQISGAYELLITPQKAQVIGCDNTGLFYDVESFLSAVTEGDKLSIAAMTVKDKPRIDYRGVFLNVGGIFIVNNLL